MAEGDARGGLSPVIVVLALLAAGSAAWLLGLNSFGGPDLADLTASTTNSRLPGAPEDPDPVQGTDGLVVHPRKMTALYAAPDGRAFAKIGPKQFGPTWLPVVEKTDGWVRVLLPSRPNGSTGWIRDRRLEKGSTPYLIRVHLAARTLEVLKDGESIGTWPAAIGKPDTPTPPGRTFVLGSINDDQQSYSPVILPLGTHSATLDTYGGGPGTVALHGWGDPSVFGTAVSHGCVRVPSDALDLLSQVPLGTIVLIDQS